MKNMRPGTRTQLSLALKHNNNEEIKEILTRYLIDKTQFKYTRGALSQFGREWGGLVNAYTRWPAEIISDVRWISKQKDGRLKNFMERYGALWMLAAGLETSRSTISDKENERLKALVGYNVMTWSPLSSVYGISPTPSLLAIGE